MTKLMVKVLKLWYKLKKQELNIDTKELISCTDLEAVKKYKRVLH